jgi:hypothetical protein
MVQKVSLRYKRRHLVDSREDSLFLTPRVVAQQFSRNVKPIQNASNIPTAARCFEGSVIDLQRVTTKCIV